MRGLLPLLPVVLPAQSPPRAALEPQPESGSGTVLATDARGRPVLDLSFYKPHAARGAEHEKAAAEPGAGNASKVTGICPPSLAHGGQGRPPVPAGAAAPGQ